MGGGLLHVLGDCLSVWGALQGYYSRHDMFRVAGGVK